jgi:hypothetical protein
MAQLVRLIRQDIRCAIKDSRIAHQGGQDIARGYGDREQPERTTNGVHEEPVRSSVSNDGTLSGFDVTIGVRKRRGIES